MKICPKCNIEKSDDDFYLHKRNGLSWRCKSCVKKYNKEHFQVFKLTPMYEKQKERLRIAVKPKAHERYERMSRKWRLRNVFGITEEDYNRMLVEQKGLCAICGNPETKLNACSNNKTKIKRLSIDHNHSTGKVRALLCDSCNNGIARFGENVEYMANAISYIEKHKIKAEALMEA